MFVATLSVDGASGLPVRIMDQLVCLEEAGGTLTMASSGLGVSIWKLGYQFLEQFGSPRANLSDRSTVGIMT